MSHDLDQPFRRLLSTHTEHSHSQQTRWRCVASARDMPGRPPAALTVLTPPPPQFPIMQVSHYPVTDIKYIVPLFVWLCSCRSPALRHVASESDHLLGWEQAWLGAKQAAAVRAAMATGFKLGLADVEKLYALWAGWHQRRRRSWRRRQRRATRVERVSELNDQRSQDLQGLPINFLFKCARRTRNPCSSRRPQLYHTVKNEGQRCLSR